MEKKSFCPLRMMMIITFPDSLYMNECFRCVYVHCRMMMVNIIQQQTKQERNIFGCNNIAQMQKYMNNIYRTNNDKK